MEGLSNRRPGVSKAKHSFHSHLHKALGTVYGSSRDDPYVIKDATPGPANAADTWNDSLVNNLPSHSRATNASAVSSPAPYSMPLSPPQLQEDTQGYVHTQQHLIPTPESTPSFGLRWEHHLVGLTDPVLGILSTPSDMLPAWCPSGLRVRELPYCCSIIAARLISPAPPSPSHPAPTPYLEYEIACKVNNYPPFTIKRRYSMFVALRDQLCKSYPAEWITKLPAHTYQKGRDKITKDFLQSRVQAMCAFFSDLLARPTLARSHEVVTFLELTAFCHLREPPAQCVSRYFDAAVPYMKSSSSFAGLRTGHAWQCKGSLWVVVNGGVSLRGAFKTWAAWAYNGPRRRMRAAAAINRLYAAWCGGCFSQWQSYVSHRQRQRRVVARASERIGRGLMVRCWNEWAYRTRARGNILKSRVRQFLGRRQWRILLAWRRQTEHESLMRRRAAACMMTQAGRRLKIILNVWAAYARRQRLVARRARAFWVRGVFRVQRRVLAAWRDAASEASAETVRMRRVVSTWQHRAVATAFYAWRERTQVASRAAGCLHVLRGRELRTVGRAALIAWWKWSINQRYLRRQSMRVIFRSARLLISTCFRAWRWYLQRIHDAETLIQGVLRRAMFGVMAAAFDAWVVFRCNRRQMAVNLIKMMRSIEATRLSQSFFRWRAVTEESMSCKRKLLKIVLRLRNHLLHRSFQTWHDNAVWVRRTRTKQKLVLHRMRNLLLAESFDHWRVWSQTRARHARRIARHLSVLYGKTMRDVFNAWRGYKSDKKKASTLIVKVLKRMLHFKLAMAFENWRETTAEWHRQRNLCLRVITGMQRRLLVAALRSWRIWTDDTIAIKGRLRATIIRWNQRAVFVAFKHWHNIARGRHVLRKAAGNLLARSTMGRMRAILRLWRARCATAQSASKMIDSLRRNHGTRTLRSLFKAWWELVRAKIVLKKAGRCLGGRISRILAMTCLRGWRTAAVRAMRARVVIGTADSRRRTRVLLHMMSTWRVYTVLTRVHRLKRQNAAASILYRAGWMKPRWQLCRDILRSWYCVVERNRRNKSLLDRRWVVLRMRAAHGMLQGWHEHATRRRERDLRVRGLIIRRWRRRVALLMRWWKEHTLSRRSKLLRLRSVKHALGHSTSYRVLKSWRAHTKWVVRARAVVERMQMSREGLRLSRCMQAWARLVSTLRQERRQETEVSWHRRRTRELEVEVEKLQGKMPGGVALARPLLLPYASDVDAVEDSEDSGNSSEDTDMGVLHASATGATPADQRDLARARRRMKKRDPGLATLERMMRQPATVDVVLKARSLMERLPNKLEAGRLMLLYVQKRLGGVQRDLDEMKRYPHPVAIVQRVWVCTLVLVNVMSAAELRKEKTLSKEGWAAVRNKIKTSESVILHRLEWFCPTSNKELRAQEKYDRLIEAMRGVTEERVGQSSLALLLLWVFVNASVHTRVAALAGNTVDPKAKAAYEAWMRQRERERSETEGPLCARCLCSVEQSRMLDTTT
eukprot:Rmarinus@m.25380